MVFESIPGWDAWHSSLWQNCIENLSAFWNYVCFKSQSIYEYSTFTENWTRYSFGLLVPWNHCPWFGRVVGYGASFQEGATLEMLWGEASTWNWAQTRFSKRCLVWSGMIDTERYGTCREDQRGSKSWLVTCTNSGTFFLHLASMVYSVYSTILYNPTVPQLILHVFIHYVFVSKGNLIRALRVAWQRMQNCGNYMCYHLLHVVHQPLSRGSMMFHRESCCLTTSPRNLLEQQVQMAMKSDSSREVYDDIMIAAHGILVVWQTTTGTARNVGAREVQSSSKLVIQCYSKYVHMRFSMIQHDSCKKKIVGIRWNPPNAHRVGSGVGAYRRILEGIDPPRLMQAREEMLCLAFGVARWISENVWDGLWWFIYIYI